MCYYVCTFFFLYPYVLISIFRQWDGSSWMSSITVSWSVTTQRVFKTAPVTPRRCSCLIRTSWWTRWLVSGWRLVASLCGTSGCLFNTMLRLCCGLVASFPWVMKAVSDSQASLSWMVRICVYLTCMRVCVCVYCISCANQFLDNVEIKLAY